MGKKRSFGLIDILLLAVACLGAVIAVVGLFVPWFALTGEGLGQSSTEYLGLFEEWPETDFPILLVQIFGIVAAVVAVLTAVVYVLRAFEVVKVSFLARIFVVALAAVFGILTIVFAGSFAAEYGTLDLWIGSISFTIAFGTIFTGVGTIAAGAALLLN